MIEILFVAFVVLQAIDFLTTRKGLQLGLAEGNPIMARLFRAMPAERSLLLVKLAMVVAIGAAVFFEQMDEVALAILVAIYAAVALNNAYRIRRASHVR